MGHRRPTKYKAGGFNIMANQSICKDRVLLNDLIKSYGLNYIIKVEFNIDFIISPKLSGR